MKTRYLAISTSGHRSLLNVDAAAEVLVQFNHAKHGVAEVYGSGSAKGFNVSVVVIPIRKHPHIREIVVCDPDYVWADDMQTCEYVSES